MVILYGQLNREQILEMHSLGVISIEEMLARNCVSNYWMMIGARVRCAESNENGSAARDHASGERLRRAG